MYIIIPTQLSAVGSHLICGYIFRKKAVSSSLFCIPLQEGVTALSFTTQNRHVDVVRVLLQHGAQDLPRNVSTYTLWDKY